MKLKYIFLLPLLLVFFTAKPQTPLTEAVDFQVKTLDSQMIELFPLLEEGKIVVIDFFSVYCHSCQLFAYDFQMAYERFGFNEGNVFFMAINVNGNNYEVEAFDSTYNITLPSVSGLDGGGNKAYDAYMISSNPTVIVIQPDKNIFSQRIWEPTVENITQTVIEAGGIFVGVPEKESQDLFSIYPNPASGYANLQFKEHIEQANIAIRSLNGQLLYETELNALQATNFSSNYRLNLPTLENGIYIVDVSVGAARYIQKLAVIN